MKTGLRTTHLPSREHHGPGRLQSCWEELLFFPEEPEVSPEVSAESDFSCFLVQNIIEATQCIAYTVMDTSKDVRCHNRLNISSAGLL